MCTTYKWSRVHLIKNCKRKKKKKKTRTHSHRVATEQSSQLVYETGIHKVKPVPGHMANLKLATISIHLSRGRYSEKQNHTPTQLWLWHLKLKVLSHARDVVTMVGYCYAFAKVFWVVFKLCCYVVPSKSVLGGCHVYGIWLLKSVVVQVFEWLSGVLFLRIGKGPQAFHGLKLRMPEAQ